MKDYTTQMDAARKGVITEQLRIVARKERMTPEELLPLVASGKVVICANKNHACLDPQGIGSMLSTKINVNLGVSRDCRDYGVEMRKVMEAVRLGAHAVMDLSSHGDTGPKAVAASGLQTRLASNSWMRVQYGQPASGLRYLIAAQASPSIK